MQDVLTLKNAEVGKNYKILKIEGTGPVRRRIMDMGLTKNAQFSVVKVAPLGDPVQIKIRGYELSVRRDDAEIVEVVEI